MLVKHITFTEEIAFETKYILHCSYGIFIYVDTSMYMLINSYAYDCARWIHISPYDDVVLPISRRILAYLDHIGVWLVPKLSLIGIMMEASANLQAILGRMVIGKYVCVHPIDYVQIYILFLKFFFV